MDRAGEERQLEDVVGSGRVAKLRLLGKLAGNEDCESQFFQAISSHWTVFFVAVSENSLISMYFPLPSPACGVFLSHVLSFLPRPMKLLCTPARCIRLQSTTDDFPEVLANNQ